METTIKINTDALTTDFIQGIKKLFPHKTVEITIQAADETDYILGNPVFAQTLQDRIAVYEAKKQVITLKADDLV
nr:hypothetical protein [Bacteroidota bacterium]